MTLGLPGIEPPPPLGARREADFYPTPENLIRPFAAVLARRLMALPLDVPVIEPACGDGRLLRAMASLPGGDLRRMFGIDIRREAVAATWDWGFEGAQADWLSDEALTVLEAWEAAGGGASCGARAFVTNPPFSVAADFARRCVERAGPAGLVVLLVRISWFEPTIDRADWLADHACDVWWPPQRGQFTDGGTDTAPTVWAIWPREDGGTVGNLHRYLGRHR